ncbi:hypothetical protein [Qaidamihabitans albus]|uniref:hypothetical protein n=1 Tax=Qaidamihabitans albus TaxID=2795733 RepID=UPI0018F17AA9|nr:hypothetical protein [Qaidamihabitans albus]
MDKLDLLKQANALGENHGWSHASFCTAYGWPESGDDTILTGRTPLQLLDYLLAGDVVETTAAEYRALACDMAAEYLSGYADGIRTYEQEVRDD